MKNLILSAALIFSLTGCQGLHEQYVQADLETYKYASPKLKEWAAWKASQGDSEWVQIVEDKDTAWAARLDKAKEYLAEE